MSTVTVTQTHQNNKESMNVMMVTLEYKLRKKETELKLAVDNALFKTYRLLRKIVS